MNRSFRVMLLISAAFVALASGCAASTPSFPGAATSAPPPEATARPIPSRTAAPQPAATPAPAITALTAPVPTLAAGPRMRRFPAVEGPPEVEATLRAATGLVRRVGSPTAGPPDKEELVEVYRLTAGLMQAVSQQLSLMVPSQRAQALKLMDELVNGIVPLLSGYIQTTNEEGPTIAFGTPVAAQGTPLTVIGTPRALTGLSLPSPSELLAHDVLQIQVRAVELAQGRPSADDLVVLTTSLGSTATTVRQLSGYLSVGELQRLCAGMADTLGTLATLTAVSSP